MSTRKLIVASLICGLLILVAGSVKLLQTASTDSAAATLYAVGTTREIAGLRVTVTEITVTAERTLVNITMTGASDESPLEGWSMVANGEITSPLASTDCVSAADEVRCTLQFVVAVGTPTIVFSRDGEKTQWLGA